MKIIHEFREFAVRGNVIDLAVGVIIGTAFSGITNSLVKDIIMPPIAAIMGNIDFTEMKITLLHASAGHAAITMNYGSFIQTLVNFFIVAWAMFFMIKAMNSLKRQSEAGETDAPPPPRQEVLLEEIRDLLQEQSKTAKAASKKTTKKTAAKKKPPAKKA